LDLLKAKSRRSVSGSFDALAVFRITRKSPEVARNFSNPPSCCTPDAPEDKQRTDSIPMARMIFRDFKPNGLEPDRHAAL
jgi:hypothetical protein